MDDTFLYLSSVVPTGVLRDAKEEKREEYYEGKEVKGKMEKRRSIIRVRRSEAKNNAFEY